MRWLEKGIPQSIDKNNRTKWNKPVTETNTVWVHLYEVSRVITHRDSSRMVAARGWGEV